MEKKEEDWKGATRSERKPNQEMSRAEQKHADLVHDCRKGKGMAALKGNELKEFSVWVSGYLSVSPSRLWE